MKISLTTKRFSRGLTLLELLLVMMIVIAIFVLPIHAVYKKEKAHADRVQCVNNLKQLGLASLVWQEDRGGEFTNKYPWQIAQTNGGTMEFTSGPNLWRNFQVVSNELSTPTILVCPADGERTSATNFSQFNNANISYFLNLDATATNSEGFLSGDRNLTNGTPIENGILKLTPNLAAGWDRGFHNQANNLLMADGSIYETGARGLRDVIVKTVPTNHLLMPVLAP